MLTANNDLSFKSAAAPVFSLIPIMVTTSLQDHRAPSVGLFLLGNSAALCLLRPSSSSSYLTSIQSQVEFASELLAPTLVSFDFLWLSKDQNTAHILLLGSCLLLGVYDWLSADALPVLTRCLGLSSLSCTLTVCLFASNAAGAVGALALSLPLLMAPGVATSTVTPLVSAAASDVVLKGFLKGSMCVGCWASTTALHKFLVDVTDQCSIDI